MAGVCAHSQIDDVNQLRLWHNRSQRETFDGSTGRDATSRPISEPLVIPRIPDGTSQKCEVRKSLKLFGNTNAARIGNSLSCAPTLVDSVFRLFLANGNTPLSSTELGEQLRRDAKTILRTISGIRVYKGLRPCL